MDFKEKYLKYKKKYINLKQKGRGDKIDVNSSQRRNNAVTSTDQPTTRQSTTIPDGSIGLPFPNNQPIVPQTPTNQPTTDTNAIPVRPTRQSTIPETENNLPILNLFPAAPERPATPERPVRQAVAPNIRDSRNEEAIRYREQNRLDNSPVMSREDFTQLIEDANRPENRRSQHNGREIDDEMWNWVTNNVVMPDNIVDPITFTILERPRRISTNNYDLSQFVINRLGNICPFTRLRFTVSDSSEQILTDIDNWWTRAIQEYDNRDRPTSPTKKIKLSK